MKIKNYLLMFAFTILVLVGCKNQEKKNDTTVTNSELVAQNNKNISLNIEGMTCDIGCAKTIQSKLSKKEGVLNATVSFKDKKATIKYDASKINKAGLVTFIEGIGNGETYKITETSSNNDCKRKPECDKKEAKTTCKPGCEKKDCKKEAKNCSNPKCVKKGCKKGEKTACKPDCKKEDCKKGEKTTCKPGCEKKDCKKVAKSNCKPGCEKEDCKKA